MADGGSTIAPYHGLADNIPDDVKALVEETAANIRSGAFVVPLDVSEPKSD